MAAIRLFNNLGDFGDSPALVDETDKQLTFSQLLEFSVDLKDTIGTRRLVFCLCSNQLASIAGYVAMQAAGQVCLMLNAGIDQDKLVRLMEAFHPNYVWAPRDTNGPFELTDLFEIDDYSLFRVSTNEVELHPELALLMPTSGSTGSPNMVRQSSFNLVSNASSISESLRLTREDSALTTLPMNYTYGLSIVNSQLHIGGRVFVSDLSVVDRRFLEVVSTSGVTYFGGVPYTYELLSRIGISKFEGSSLRMLTQAGGRLKPELVQSVSAECRKLNIDFYVMYGQTEATARMSVLSPEDALEVPSSIGRPIPGGSFRLLEPDTEHVVPENSVGELEYSGPNVTMGYATTWADLVRGNEREGRLRTGDLARRDEQGRYYIVGRKKRFIKLFGHRVSLDDVEQHLSELGHEAVCTGEDDLLIVHVVGENALKEIAADTARFIGTNQRYVLIRSINEIPRSESGKILYSGLPSKRRDIEQ